MSSSLTLKIYLIVFASLVIDPAIPQQAARDNNTFKHSTFKNCTGGRFGHCPENEHISSNITIEKVTFNNTTVSDNGLTIWTYSAIEEVTSIPSGYSAEDGSLSSNTSNKTIAQNKTDNSIIRIKPSVGGGKRFDVIKWAVHVVATSVIAVFGLIGNCISVCVLASPRMKSPNSIILIYLAFFDTLILLRHILFTTVQNILSQTLSRERLIEIYLNPVQVIYRPFEHVAYFGSIYTTILLTAERFVAVMFPLRSSSLCTIKRARFSGLVILIVSVVYSVPKFMRVTLHSEKDPITNMTKFIVVRRNFSAEVKFFYMVTRKYLEVVFLLAIPALILIVLNSCILYKLWQRSRIFKGESFSVSKRRSTMTERVTAITMAITATFCVNLIIVNLDRNLCLVVKGSKREFEGKCYGLHLAANLVFTFNSAVNFLYYCLFGSKFRNVLCSLCSRLVIKRQQSSSNSVQELYVIK